MSKKSLKSNLNVLKMDNPFFIETKPKKVDFSEYDKIITVVQENRKELLNRIKNHELLEKTVDEIYNNYILSFESDDLDDFSELIAERDLLEKRKIFFNQKLSMYGLTLEKVRYLFQNNMIISDSDNIPYKELVEEYSDIKIKIESLPFFIYSYEPSYKQKSILNSIIESDEYLYCNNNKIRYQILSKHLYDLKYDIFNNSNILYRIFEDIKNGYNYKTKKYLPFFYEIFLNKINNNTDDKYNDHYTSQIQFTHEYYYFTRHTLDEILNDFISFMIDHIVKLKEYTELKSYIESEFENFENKEQIQNYKIEKEYDEILNRDSQYGSVIKYDIDLIKIFKHLGFIDNLNNYGILTNYQKAYFIYKLFGFKERKTINSLTTYIKKSNNLPIPNYIENFLNEVKKQKE